MVTVTPLSELLPDLRESVEQARTSTGWDLAILRREVGRAFDFLGPYVEAEVLNGTQADAVAAAARTAGGSALAVFPPPERAGAAGATTEWLLLRFTPPTGTDPVAGERAFERASQVAARGDVAKALPEFERLARQFPQVPKYHRTVGQALFALGRAEEAEDALLRCLRLDPRDADAYTVYGNLFAQRGAHADALTMYERSLTYGHSVVALTNIAVTRMRLGQREAGLRVFRQAIAEDPQYPNAHHGLAVALMQAKDVALLPEALAEAEATLTALGDRRRDPTLWDTVQGMIAQISAYLADDQAPKAAARASRVIVERETAGVGAGDAGIPVRIEQARLEGALAKLEMAWVHGRDQHRLLVNAQGGAVREQFVLHELEHLVLAEAARAAGTNRWFTSNAEADAVARRAIDGDLDRLRRRGVRGDDLERFVGSLLNGLRSQLFNFPIDLLIESRLFDANTDCRELQYQSIRQQVETGVRIAEDTTVRSSTPTKIFRASVGMNVALALWLEHRFPRRTDFVTRFKQSDAFATGQQLYAQWRAAAPTWTPGAEYGWVDTWAEILGLRNWYGWIAGNAGTDRPARPEPRAGEQGTAPGADPLSVAQEAAVTMYMLAAMEWAAERPPQEVAMVGMRAAMLGQNGIRYHDPESRYTLPGFRDEPISGLQFLATMYVLIKQMMPGVDQGIDLEGPYAAARQLFDHRDQSTNEG